MNALAEGNGRRVSGECIGNGLEARYVAAGATSVIIRDYSNRGYMV
jgi:hypothetical protein